MRLKEDSGCVLSTVDRRTSRPPASMVGLNHEDVLPEIKVVRDGFVSLIGYQAKGYGLVPVL